MEQKKLLKKTLKLASDLGLEIDKIDFLDISLNVYFKNKKISALVAFNDNIYVALYTRNCHSVKTLNKQNYKQLCKSIKKELKTWS